MNHEQYRWIDYFNGNDFFELRRANDDNGICALIVLDSYYIVSSCTDSFIKRFNAENLISAKIKAIEYITEYIRHSEGSEK